MNGGPVVKTMCLKCGVWLASLVAQMVKNLPSRQKTWIQSLLGRSPGEGNGNELHRHFILSSFSLIFSLIPWRREWQPNPVSFFPGENHGQRSLAVYSPWGPKESDRTERLTLFSFIGELRSCTLHGVAKRKKKFIHSFCKCLLNIWCFIYCPQH